MESRDYRVLFSVRPSGVTEKKPSSLDGTLIWWRVERNIPRSRLLSEPAKVFGNHDPEMRDLLLEYFIPMNKFSEFVKQAAPIIKKEYDSLLNVTVREIAKDIDTALPYARQDMFGLVMLFTINRALEAENGISSMAGELIELAYSMNGTFYLPYLGILLLQLNLGNVILSFLEFLIKKKEFDLLRKYLAADFIRNTARTIAGMLDLTVHPRYWVLSNDFNSSC